MVKNSTVIIGITLFFVVGIGTYAVLAAFRPKQATNETTETEVLVDVQDGDQTSDDTSATGATSSFTTARQDTTVKNTLAMIHTQLTSYTSNNRGAVIQTEAELASFTTIYLADIDLTNPVSNNTYTISLTDGEDTIHYQPGYTCDADGVAGIPGTTRQVALTVTLPSGAPYCFSS